MSTDTDRDREFTECIDAIAATAQSAPASARSLVELASVVTDARELFAHSDGNSGMDQIEAMGILVMRMADIAVKIAASAASASVAKREPVPLPPVPLPADGPLREAAPDLPELEAEMQRVCDRMQQAIERGHVKLAGAFGQLAKMTAALDAYGINMLGGDAQLFERAARMEFIPILDDLIDEIERGEAEARN